MRKSKGWLGIVGIGLAYFVGVLLIAGVFFGLRYIWTDAGWAKIEALGNPAHIVCWSAGHKIYDGHSTGKVHSEDTSDGYFFKEKDTGKPKEVSGDCVITYETD
jgi:hypothetical protein